MEAQQAVERLAALAHDARLEVFRLLVRAGPAGRPAGEIAATLGIPPQTLTFHLQHLATAGLIAGRRQGRSRLYSLRADGMRELLAFLSEDCCQGRRELCVPMGVSPRSRWARSLRAAERPTVLFLCSKNSARSQMAEALLQSHAGDRFTVHSAGLRPEAVHPLTIRVLDEIGIDTESCRAKDLGAFVGKVPIHAAIVLCERTQRDCPGIHPFALRRLYWPFEDPAAVEGTEAVRLDGFRAVRDAIRTRIQQWLLDEVRSERWA